MIAQHQCINISWDIISDTGRYEFLRFRRLTAYKVSTFNLIRLSFYINKPQWLSKFYLIYTIYLFLIDMISSLRRTSRASAVLSVQIPYSCYGIWDDFIYGACHTVYSYVADLFRTEVSYLVRSIKYKVLN